MCEATVILREISFGIELDRVSVAIVHPVEPFTDFL